MENMEKIASSFRHSVERLQEILREPKTVANRDSAIKRFELTFELAWKSIQAFMKHEGLLCRSPRVCLWTATVLGRMAGCGRTVQARVYACVNRRECC